MKLDRNLNPNGRGKYALLKLRKLDEFAPTDDPFQRVAQPIVDAIKVLEKAGILDWGGTPETEFFVIRLKDQYADSALRAYAYTAARIDPEYSAEVEALANRSGINHPLCRLPD